MKKKELEKYYNDESALLEKLKKQAMDIDDKIKIKELKIAAILGEIIMLGENKKKS